MVRKSILESLPISIDARFLFDQSKRAFDQSKGILNQSKLIKLNFFGDCSESLKRFQVL